MLIRICKEGAYEQTLGEFDCCTWLDISPLDNGKKESLQTRIERHSAGKILAAAVLKKSLRFIFLVAVAQGCTDDTCEEEWALDQLADVEEFLKPSTCESELLDVRLLQTQLTQQRGPVQEAAPLTEHVMSLDHNGKVCMLCNRPLPERIDRPYEVFRTDCGKHSSATGPSLDVMAMPAVQVAGTGGKAEGFCALNFAKSCADAVANKDYLYFAKGIDFNHESMRSNVRWDGRYCLLNGFLETSVVHLQKNYSALQQHAEQLCETKYSKHGIDRLSFLDMLQLSKQEDSSAPSLQEAEAMAAWNCAMGDLACDMAMCAYSFCKQADGRSTSLYGECPGWDPAKSSRSCSFTAEFNPSELIRCCQRRRFVMSTTDAGFFQLSLTTQAPRGPVGDFGLTTRVASDCICVALPDMLHTALTLLVLEAVQPSEGIHSTGASRCSRLCSRGGERGCGKWGTSAKSLGQELSHPSQSGRVRPSCRKPTNQPTCTKSHLQPGRFGLLLIWRAKGLLFPMPKRNRDGEGLSRVDAAEGDANWLTGRPYSKRFFEILKARRKLPCWGKQKAAVEMVSGLAKRLLFSVMVLEVLLPNAVEHSTKDFDAIVPLPKGPEVQKASSEASARKYGHSQVHAAESIDPTEEKQEPPRRHNRRNQVREMNRRKLSEFLRTQGFSSDVNEPRMEQQRGCFFFSFSRKKQKEIVLPFSMKNHRPKQETIYPIHTAAELGDVKLVRLLLAAGADSQQRTSKGHLPIDFALAREFDHSHDGVIALLEEELSVTNFRDALHKMQAK
eukprot:symbB.v1.2.016267.t2/scaffold1234.1/size130244/9